VREPQADSSLRHRGPRPGTRSPWSPPIRANVTRRNRPALISHRWRPGLRPRGTRGARTLRCPAPAVFARCAARGGGRVLPLVRPAGPADRSALRCAVVAGGGWRWWCARCWSWWPPGRGGSLCDSSPTGLPRPRPSVPVCPGDRKPATGRSTCCSSGSTPAWTRTGSRCRRRSSISCTPATAARAATAGSARSADEEPTPTMTIEIAVDVRPAADGTWSGTSTPGKLGCAGLAA